MSISDIKLEVKVGFYNGNLEDLSKKYGGNFSGECCKIFGKDVVLLRDKKSELYAMTLYKSQNSPKDYNFRLYCFAKDSVNINELIKNFEMITGIQTRDAPEGLKREGSRLLEIARFMLN